MALERAVSIASRDLTHAATIVAAHERLLSDVATAGNIVARALAAAKEARRAEASALLADAEVALAQGRARQCRDLFARVDVRDLLDEGATRARALERQLATAEDHLRSVQRFQRLRSVGAFRAAQAVAADLAGISTGQEAARWVAEGEAIAEQVHRTYAPMLEEQKRGARAPPELFPSRRYGRDRSPRG